MTDGTFHESNFPLEGTFDLLCTAFKWCKIG